MQKQASARNAHGHTSSEELMNERARADSLSARVAMLEAQLDVLRQTGSGAAQNRLSALLSLTSALLVTHDLGTILQLVVREAVGLFPGAGGALIFLGDQEASLLRLRASSVGTQPDLSLAFGQGLPGRAYIAPRAMLVLGPEVDETMAELSPAQHMVLQQLVQPWPSSSALLAPLRLESERIGALVLFGGPHAHLLHPRDLPFVQALADLAAVAIAEQRSGDRADALARDLDRSQTLHAEARARLDSAQAQLLQSAKLAAVGELAASVAHEINNPLYAARNSLYLVEQELPEKADTRQFLSIAQAELARIARIITRMRDFYRPTREELEPTHVNDLLKETMELVQTHLRHGQVNVNASLSPGLPGLMAHADQLRQVFLNLMLNACDAMPNGGTLFVATTLGHHGDDLTPEIVINIRDTGTGILAEHLPHLFEPFYTTKPQGTGLGLAISAHIVSQHAGTITVDSQLGVGSTFMVRLPAA